MRERRPGDWRVDLNRRHPLERVVEAAIDRHQSFTRLTSSTSSLDRLDFQVLGPTERLCEIELKAKHQRYQGWTQYSARTSEADLFILDELAMRKILSAGRYAFLVVHDQPSRRWVVWSVMDLVLATKHRANRRLAVGAGPLKAKLLLDSNDSPHHCGSVESALDAVADLAKTADSCWSSIDGWPTNRRIPTIGAAS